MDKSNKNNLIMKSMIFSNNESSCNSIVNGYKWQQEMPPSQQIKSAKKDSERYLMFGPNHILVTLMRDDRRSSIHENVCRWCFLNRFKLLVGPSKLRNRVFLGKYSKWNLNFKNWSKTCLGFSEPAKRLAA